MWPLWDKKINNSSDNLIKSASDSIALNLQEISFEVQNKSEEVGIWGWQPQHERPSPVRAVGCRTLAIGLAETGLYKIVPAPSALWLIGAGKLNINSNFSPDKFICW